MKNDSIWKEIELYNADGVDFVSMSFYANLAKNGNPLPFQIYKSYSKEEWETCMSTTTMLETPRVYSIVYWRLNAHGKKYYVN